MNILFATSEVAPYSKTGGLADVSRSLPAELKLLGHDVSIITPLYKSVSPVDHQLAERLNVLEIPVEDGKLTIRVLEGRTVEGVRAFFLAHELFEREPIYGPEGGGEYPDNGYRFGVFSRAICEFVRTMAVPVDVIHCNEWQTGLVPVFLEESYPADPKLSAVQVVETIHNLPYQGLFDKEVLTQLELPAALFGPDHLEFYGRVNYLKGGILYADAITTVSPTYAREITTEEYGAGLSGVLAHRGDDVKGIINGVDYKLWDPQTDSLIPYNYDGDHLNGKRRCKASLQREFGLPVLPGVPLLAFVGRLAEQKGVDLISDLLDDMVDRGVQLVLVGTGEVHYETALKSWAEEFPEQVAVFVGFDEKLAHRVIAGADALLIPSKYEPCGLTQLYALRYGTVPVARATGGLVDTIEPLDLAYESGTGILFDEFSADGFFGALEQTLELFDKPRLWREVQLRGMSRDFSWRRSAQDYTKLYESLSE